MRGLKSALGHDIQEKNYQHKASESTIRGMKDTSSIWSIAQGLDAQQKCLTSTELNNVTAQIIQTLQKAKNNNLGIPLGQNILKELIDCCSRYESLQKNEHDNLKILEKNMNKVIITAPEHLENEVARVIELIKQRKRKLRNKDKKSPMEFDEIADKLFKKPGEQKKNRQKKRKILQTQAQGFIRKKSSKKQDQDGTKNSGNSQDSQEKKLGRLLSSQAIDPVKKNSFTQSQEQQEQSGYSFSAMMSATTIKQRHPRKNEIKDNEIAAYTMKSKFQKNENSSDNVGDEAFIFYRPKKNTRYL